MNVIAQSIHFSLLFGAFCFVAGLLMRGAFTQRVRRRDYEIGREDGFYEALMLTPSSRDEEKRLRIVK